MQSLASRPHPPPSTHQFPGPRLRAPRLPKAFSGCGPPRSWRATPESRPGGRPGDLASSKSVPQAPSPHILDHPALLCPGPQLSDHTQGGASSSNPGARRRWSVTQPCPAWRRPSLPKDSHPHPLPSAQHPSQASGPKRHTFPRHTSVSTQDTRREEGGQGGSVHFSPSHF